MTSYRSGKGASRTGLTAGTPLWFVQSSGIGLILAGALVDAAYHLWWTGDDHFASLGLVGHVITLAGMVLTMSAVIATGLRCSTRRSPKGEFDAGRSTSAS
jgi:hypothetical protein